MSLRWRLTILSTLILGVVFAAFGSLAYLTVSYFFNKTIDDNLERQTTAVLTLAQQRHILNLTEFSSEGQIGIVFYTLYNSEGGFEAGSRQVPVDPALVFQALDGQSVMTTKGLPDGNRVRVLLRPVPGEFNTPIGVLQAASPLDINDRILKELGLFFIVSALVLLVVGAVGSYILTGRTLRVVEKIRQKAHQIEVSQDLTQRIPVPGTDDEVGHLVQTFNQMLSRLQAAFEAQRRFVADSSHELRTPLTVIKSNMHLLRRTDDAQERAELIDITEAEISRLNRMVNDLLFMAQMQAGHDLKPVLRVVELDSLLLDVFARTRAIAAVKGQRVILVHEDIAACMGDRDQLQHLLLNLVDNATKYTPEGGTITLGLWTESGWARLEVTDTGPGIASADLPHIFERFYRTHGARQTDRGGSGLGLAIVKSIADAHKGRMEVFSKPGEGTAFRLWLRLLPSSRPAVVDEEQPAVGELQATEG